MIAGLGNGVILSEAKDLSGRYTKDPSVLFATLRVSQDDKAGHPGP
jgi:hypothetical protein